MKARTLITLAAATAALGLATSAKATTIAYEPFDYTPGQSVDTNLNSGYGWTSTWGALGSSVGNGSFTVTSDGSTSPTSPSLYAFGNKGEVVPMSGSTFSARAINPIGSGTLYASMLIDKTNTGSRFLTSNFRSGGAQKGSFGSISNQTSWSYGVAGRPASPTGISNAVEGATLLVARIDFNENDFNADGTMAGERIRLYVNPTPGAPEPAIANADSHNADSPVANIEFDYGIIDSIDLGAGLGNGSTTTTSTGTFDEYRLATTWADVTPADAPFRVADFNEDGQVTVGDLGILATHFNETTDKGKWVGDANRDGSVSVGDLGILATYFNQGVGAGAVSFDEALKSFPALATAAASVPEPSAMLGMAIGGLGLLSRRRAAR